MTRRTRAEERIAALDAAPPAPPIDPEAIAAERDAALAKAEEYLVALQRERAEFANFRRRTADERERTLGLAGEDLIRKALTLADDFDRAVETRPLELDGNAWVEGIAAIDRKLRLLLESEGVREVDAAPGSPFDPRQHEAIATVPGSRFGEGEIVEEVRRGYWLGDRLIRPALVAVASASEGDAPTARPN